MPVLELAVGGRQRIMSGIKKVAEHAVEVEINEAGTLAEQERVARQHLLERQETPREALQQLRLLFAPQPQTAPAELAFLVPHESPPFAFGDQLLPVNVIEFEAVSFHFALKEAPEDALHAFQFARKQAQLKSVIEIFGDDLGVLVGFEH